MVPERTRLSRRIGDALTHVSGPVESRRTGYLRLIPAFSMTIRHRSISSRSRA